MAEDETLASDGTTPSSQWTHASMPEQIGRFRLVRMVGSGGMGEVFEAQQLEPIRRRVALKVIKRGMDTESIVARFESERQALAVMDHECIAKVFDAGATPDGRPYFVMEFVAGVPITDYCVGENLDAKRRLELFIRVCEGVQHAHQKGIIHRDIKPSNVMVTLKDGEPLPKIIDFGLAKATQQSLTDRKLQTELGQLVGTPEYMSPEQAEMSGLDVDTRTDVYSLGVLLYVLLVGELPFDSVSLRDAGFDEIRRKIREDDPVKPSARLHTIITQHTSQGQRPRPEQLALRRHLRGDLDWIVMKSMEKARARRYASAGELADDIDRHLRDMPVRASPPSTSYRTKKFIRRHKVGVITSCLVLMALVLGAVGTTVAWVRARRAERTAQREAATAREVSDFLVHMFEVSDPDESVGNTITAREILDEGASRIADELSDQPVTQARLMHTMGEVYRSLGLYDPSRTLLEKSLELRRTTQGDASLETAASQAELAKLNSLEARYEAAEPLFLAALATREAQLGPDHLDVAETVDYLAQLYSRLGREEAEGLFRRSLAIRERALGPNAPEVAESLNGLGIHYFRAEEFDKAEPLYQRALAIWERTLGADVPRVATALNNLAILYRRQGKYEAAVPLYQRAISIYERTLGPDHDRVMGSVNNLGLVYFDLEDYANAEPLFERALRIGEKVYGLDHPNYASTLGNLANLKEARSDFAAAARLSRQALEIRTNALGEDNVDVAWGTGDLGRILIWLGKYAEAESLLLRAKSVFDQRLGTTSEASAWMLNDLAVLYRKAGRPEAAEGSFQQATRAFEIALGPESEFLAECLDEYATLLRDQGRVSAADSLAQRADAIRAANVN